MSVRHQGQPAGESARGDLPAPDVVNALAVTSPAAMAVFGADLRCRWANARFGELTGHTRLQGVRWRDLFPGTPNADLAALRALVETDSAPVQLILQPPSGPSPARSRRWDGRAPRVVADTRSRPTWRGVAHPVPGPGGERLLGLTCLDPGAEAPTGPGRRSGHGPDADPGRRNVLDLRSFLERVEEAIEEAGPEPSTVGMLLADVAPIGQDTPTERGAVDALVSVAARLPEVLRSEDVVTVTDPHRIAVLCRDLESPAAAMVVAERLRGHLSAVLGEGTSRRGDASFGAGTEGRSSAWDEGLRGVALPVLDDVPVLVSAGVTLARPAESAGSLVTRAQQAVEEARAAVAPASQTSSGDAASRASLLIRVTDFRARGRPTTVLHLTGELDVATVGRLRVALRALLATAQSGLVLDARGITFCDVSGMRALEEGAREARRRGLGYGVVGMPPIMRRLYEVGWADSPFAHWPTLGEALGGA